MFNKRTGESSHHLLSGALVTFISLVMTSLFASNVLAATNFQTSDAPAQKILVSTGEWSPLISAQKTGYGPISTVITEAFAVSGIEVEFRFFPWKRALQEVRSGRVVASSAWRKTNDRQQEFLFSNGVYDNLNVFFHLKSRNFDWHNLSDLKHYYLGAALGYAYSEDFEKAEERGDFEVFRVNKERSLVEMLLTQRIDAFPANREVGLQLIRSQTPEAFDQYVIHPKPISKSPLHLVFGKGQRNQALLKKFNAGLQQLKQSGRYAEIYNMTPHH